MNRTANIVLAALLLAAIGFELAIHETGWWQLAVFGLGPDIALLGGGSDGRLNPRAVPLYNLLHRYWLPIALGVLVAVGVLPVGYFVGALAWAFHIALDRSLGYRLRTRDGYQRA